MDKQTIFELATNTVAGTELPVTLTLAARLALMRKVLVDHKGGTYWDKVDARLQMIRNITGGDSKKIDKTFTQYLDTDRKKYGDDLGDVLRPDFDGVVGGNNTSET